MLRDMVAVEVEERIRILVHTIADREINRLCADKEWEELETLKHVINALQED